MQYDVVLVHFNRFPEVLETVDSVASQSPAPTRFVIVDNSPADGRLRAALASWPNVAYISANNVGYGAGMNLGIDHLRGQGELAEAVLLLTHEVLLAERCCERLLDALSSDAKVGLVGPLLARRSQPTVTWSAGGRLSSRMVPEHLLIGETIQTRHSIAISCDWADGAVLMTRTSACLDVGGFDPAYFLYWEEVDYALKLRAQGWDVVCAREALAWQEPSGTPRYLEGRNRLLLARRHYGPVRAVIETVQQGVQILRSLVGVVLGRRVAKDFGARTHAVIDGWTEKLQLERI